MSTATLVKSPTPTVHFEKKDVDRKLSVKEIDDLLAGGAQVSNTALAFHQARKRGAIGAAAPYARKKLAKHFHPFHPPTPSAAIDVSDPGLDRSDETAIAINPKNPRNIVAGAASFDGTNFTNTAYVTKDGGNTWTTVVAITDADEGAGLAFDDHGHLYYASMQGGFYPICTVSTDGGITWGPPAAFGFGDKTAVAARGRTALVGFDRLNTEACAFTLDGGATWTVHDFTDSGLGTGPLVSYDHKDLYIIYAAMDNNLKMYRSPDKGATWSGPTVIVAGNMWSSTIVGPLSYEGFALTSPGTNVAIDGKGHLHVLYIDSSTKLPMYTMSKNHGTTWSAPVNVNPERATEPHMWPCLASNKHGDLQGGSLLYDQTLGKYRILQHVKAAEEDEWMTIEADNGPWSAAGPPTGFRIGFGDYFDCDSLPQCGVSVMGWSETPNGLQPWETWVRIRDLCQCNEDRVESLEEEIEHLEEAFESNELPIPRSKHNVERFEARLHQLREKLETEERRLETCRQANPLLED
ncbi:MAG TPA: sialidase family protein [Candidatus Dormibacteraeota bacterium]|nr:sialidase family protein [Candidatus Dormibacteraeota bacterium]